MFQAILNVLPVVDQIACVAAYALMKNIQKVYTKLACKVGQLLVHISHALPGLHLPLPCFSNCHYVSCIPSQMLYLKSPIITIMRTQRYYKKNCLVDFVQVFPSRMQLSSKLYVFNYSLIKLLPNTYAQWYNMRILVPAPVIRCMRKSGILVTVQ